MDGGVTVKICGINGGRALNAAVDGGAAHIGLVFFVPSPRNVSLKDGRRLAIEARERAKANGRVVSVVALLVDPTDGLVAEVMREVMPDVLQLHGGETPARVAEIAARSRAGIWKAIPVAAKADVARADAYSCAILFDAKAPKGATLPGGNGVAFDWRILAGIASAKRFILAGGLNADNVAEALDVTGARCVDVSSGVESSPGVKDPGMIARFLQAVKAANHSV